MVSVGSLLKNKREQKKLSLSDVEKHIKVRAKFIQALEEDRWDVFTSKIYISGILKNYSQFLGLDYRKVLAFFRREYEQQEDIRFKKRVSKKYLSADSKKAVWVGFLTVLVLFVVYFLFQLFQYLRPPQIELLSPTQTVFRHDVVVKVIAKTEKEATITIFGERVYQNKEGIFEFMFPLGNGDNKLRIEVVGANGKKTVLEKIFKKTQ